MKILIVDDSLMDRKLLMNLLKKNKFENEILQAPDGEEGIKMLSSHLSDICLILLDWQMPKMDGIGFLKTVVQVPEAASIPIIMITASGSTESKNMAYEANPKLAGYLVKPYMPERLVEMIQPLIK